MALSMRNVYLQNAIVNFIFPKTKHALSLPYKSSFRNLRGSRLGRELDKTEAKFQQLLKSLKQTSKKSIINTPEFPEALVKEDTPKEENITQDKRNDIPLDDLYKRLEGKVTPLKRLPYTRQLERKYNKSLNLLRMFGQKLLTYKVPLSLGPDKLPCPVELMVPSSVTEGYRNQDEFSFGIGLDGDPKTIGFYLENSIEDSNRSCINPDNIIIIKKIHKEFIKDLQNYVQQSHLPAFIQYDDKGYWKSVSVRSTVAGHLMGIIIVHPQDLTEEQLNLEKENLRKYFETVKKSYHLKSLYFQTSPLPNSTSKQAPCELLFGDPYIIEELNGMKFQISPGSYFQANTYAAESLYDNLRKLCRLSNSTTVIDLFCGTGPVSLTFAPHVKKCFGIDLCAQSLTDAKNNAKINNQHNIEFIHGNPDCVIKSILSQDYFEDLVVVINPSRLELSKVALRSLRACKYLKKIIYISTKPKSAIDNFIRLARPCGTELSLGQYFVPLFAVPFDLSPQTEHYGLVIMFQRL